MTTPDATALLSALDEGDPSAADRLLPLVYDELRRLAGICLREERGNHTLQATALAHEVYVKLVDQTRVSWNGRAHFMGVAAELIRRVLVDHARARSAQKRGGGREPLDLSGVEIPETGPAGLDVLDLHEALAELAKLSGRQARVVELKFFGGLENQEIARAMRISETLVKNEWRFARAWLAARLKAYDGAGEG